MGDAQLARFWQNRAEDSPDSLGAPDVWLRGDDQGSQVRRRLAAGGGSLERTRLCTPNSLVTGKRTGKLVDLRVRSGGVIPKNAHGIRSLGVTVPNHRTRNFSKKKRDYPQIG